MCLGVVLHGIDLGAPPSVSHEGVALWTVIWQPVFLFSASRLCVSPWRGALGSAPTDFRATMRGRRLAGFMTAGKNSVIARMPASAWWPAMAFDHKPPSKRDEILFARRVVRRKARPIVRLGSGAAKRARA